MEHKISLESLRGWTKKLTKSELKHLREEAMVHTTEQLRRQMEYTVREYKKGKQGLYCQTCLEIGRKLGVIE